MGNQHQYCHNGIYMRVLVMQNLGQATFSLRRLTLGSNQAMVQDHMRLHPPSHASLFTREWSTTSDDRLALSMVRHCCPFISTRRIFHYVLQRTLEAKKWNSSQTVNRLVNKSDDLIFLVGWSTDAPSQPDTPTPQPPNIIVHSPHCHYGVQLH